MAEIVKIVMISEYTVGNKEEAFWDQLIVKEDSMSYEYKPEVPSMENLPEKWFRKGYGDRYKELWKQLLAKMEVIGKMESDEGRGAYEGPAFELRITFDDKSRKTLKLWGSGYILTGLQETIEQMMVFAVNAEPQQ